jgi:hypothetical protein
MGQHLNTGEITAVFQGGATLPATDQVPQKHLLRLLETEHPQKCGCFRCFLVGRAGLEPATLCLKGTCTPIPSTCP